MMILLLISVILLAVIFWQDMKTRAIWWFLPPALFAVLLLLSWKEGIILTVAVNVLFVSVMMALMTLYIAIRFGKLGNPFAAYFGLGDFLFLLAITPLFPVTGFVWFFTAGTVFVLITHLVMLIFRKENTIPYAGYFSVYTAFYLVLHAYSPELFNALTTQYGTV